MRLARISIVLALTAALAPFVLAGDDEVAEETGGEEQVVPAGEAPPVFERLRVIAGPVEKIPGSVTYVDKEELRKHDHTDIHRILRLVPGVNIQEEEGYGLRPNIGFRGSGAERSQKIALLEDGVPIAPAPYSAPAAYYFPTTGRMDGIEVRKGSSSIRQGPFTNGGVLNMISSSIPSEFSGSANLALGEDQMQRGRVKLGSSSERFGWLAETFQLSTDGFKQLDGGGSTGVDLQDYLVKARVTSGGEASIFQALELKLGRTDQSANETYLGLTAEDFESTPYRRYAGSQRDRLESDHEQVQLNYFARPSAAIDVTATLYRNDFFRNWRKLGKVSGVAIGEVLDDPETHADELAILRGEVDSDPDALNVRNNRRDYYAQGFQAVLGIHPSGRGSSHDFELGMRYHEDEEDRFQEEDLFRMTGGRMLETSAGAPGSQSNRISRASAWAFFARDRFSFDRWTITPGVRLERIDYQRLDYGKADPQRTGVDLKRTSHEVSEWIPGIGVNYQLDSASGLFFGIHRGFAPPGPGASEETEAEESINYELGYRRAQGALELQVVGFFNDYDNLLGADTLSAGGTGEGDMFNGGEVDVSGVEASLAYDLGTALDASSSIPVRFSYTYSNTEFRTSFDSDFDGWGDAVVAGDELPYVPHHQVALDLGVVRRSWSTFVNLAYKDEMRTQAGQGPIPAETAAGAHLIVDLSVNYYLRPELKSFVQVRNLADEVYVAARRPAGARPGLPRTILAGVAWDF